MHAFISRCDVQRSSLAAEADRNYRTPIEPACPSELEPAPPEPDESSDLDDFELTPVDDRNWDVFIADDDEVDPLPDHGDFWLEDPDDHADDESPELARSNW